MKKILLVLLVSICTLSLWAQPFTWTPTTVSPLNNLQEMKQMSDNSLVVVGSNNAFAKSTDLGASWNNVKIIDASFDFYSISINNEGIGLMSTRWSKIIDYATGEDVFVDGKLLKTTDFGATWTIQNLNTLGTSEPELNPNKVGCFSFDLYTVECIDANNAFIYAGWKDMTSGTKTSVGAVFQTTDGGITWNAISGNLKSNVMTAIQTVGTTTYIGGGNTLLKRVGSTTSNIYPKLVDAAAGDTTIYVYDLDVISENEFYAVTTANGLFHSNDGGTTITKMSGTGIPTGGYDMKLLSPNTIMVTSATSSKLTLDGGANWVDCHPGEACWEIAGIFNDSVVVTAKDDIYKLAVSDLSIAPKNWRKQTVTNLSVNIQQFEIIDANRVILAGGSEVVLSSSDKGLTWTNTVLPELFVQGDANSEYPVDFTGICASGGTSYANSRRFYFVNYPTTPARADLYFPGLIYKSTNNWASATLINLANIAGTANAADPTANPFHANCYGFEPYTIDAGSASLLLVWGQWMDTTSGYANLVNRSRLFRSADAGSTWTAVTGDLGPAYTTDIHFVDENTVYVVGSKRLMKSTDGGLNFTEYYLNLDPTNDQDMFIQGIIYEGANEIYLPTTGDKVWRTTSDLTVFTAFPNLAGTTDFLKVSENNYLVQGSTTKSFVSRDNGSTWITCGPGESVWSIAGIFDNKIYVLTKGEIYTIPVSQILGYPTKIENELSQNGSFRILNRLNEIEILSTDKAISRCALYSISGQLLEMNTAGEMSCTFSKSKYPQGVYIISTTSGNKNQVHKVVF